MGRKTRSEKAISFLQHYFSTYTNQHGWEKYHVDTIINDTLYGLGLAIGGKRYKFHDGFSQFKIRLLRMLRNGAKP